MRKSLCPPRKTPSLQPKQSITKASFSKPTSDWSGWGKEAQTPSAPPWRGGASLEQAASAKPAERTIHESWPTEAYGKRWYDDGSYDLKTNSLQKMFQENVEFGYKNPSKKNESLGKWNTEKKARTAFATEEEMSSKPWRPWNKTEG